MALKRITENPTISDTVVFDIQTPSYAPSVINLDPICYTVDPYEVSTVEIYYLEKSFVSENFGEYQAAFTDSVDVDLLARYEVAKTNACNAPTEENLRELSLLQQQVDLLSKKQDVYYNDAKLIATFGTDDFPAWLSTDPDNAILVHVDEDSEGNPQYCHFELHWEPKGMREGDYFICWTWMPLPTGDVVTAHEFFNLMGDTQLTTSIPTHRTYPKKYEILQDRYLPEMFKKWVSDSDETPQVIRGLNNSVGDGFAFLEDMTNQMVDVIDANATHESYLIPFANLFNLKLRSSDPTLWRRQIKRAVPLVKKKGTLLGLQEALSQAGIDLVKFTQLWQIISSYTWQECFVVEDSLEFVLSKVAILPIDTDNFLLYFRAVDSDVWQELTEDYVQFSNVEGVTYMTWVGHNLSISPIELEAGDSIRVVYKVNEIPGSSEQIIENYIRFLPLMDLRDERDQIYPPKNWNVRVIEEDDAFFDIIIPTKHPHHDPIIWGWVRTEFPYSENVYNMEEYNGSNRESTEPCDIDRTFVDPCTAGISSSYTIDINIENLSNDRLQEVQEIIKEYMPFHAVLHSINLGGKTEDFVQTRETLDTIINIHGEDVTISGNGQMIFNRVMTQGPQARRDALADVIPAPDDLLKTGVGYNSNILLYSPLVNFGTIGLSNNNILAIRSGSNAGIYTISNPNGNHAEITGIVEPFSYSAFTYRLSNVLFSTVTTNIYQDDVFKLTDENVSFYEYGIKTLWDVEQDPSVTQWTIQLTSPIAGSFDIENILPDGSLVIYDPTHILPTTSTTDISYNIINSDAVVVLSGTTGSLNVKRRGLVDVSSLAIENVRPAIEVGDYLEYITTEYPVSGFVKNQTHQFYIDDYTGGDRAGVTTNIYKRLVDDLTGYIYYNGMVLTTSINYESVLNIMNGTNAPVDPNLITDNDLFKENFLVLIGTDYYAISQWDGVNIYLAGPPLNWGVSVGTSIQYKIYQFVKEPWTVDEKITGHPTGKDATAVPAHDFDFIDRRGNEIITVNTETGVSAYAMAIALNAAKKGNEMIDSIQQQESVNYSIEYRQ